MSIFDKINKKRTGDDPQQYSDPQYDDLLYDDDLQYDDLEFEQFLERELEYDYFVDDLEIDDPQGDAGFDEYYNENYYEDEAYLEGDEVWYEPVAESGGSAFQLPSVFRSPDNMMMLICLILSVLLLFFCGFLAVRTHALSESNSRLEQRVQKDTKLRKSESEYEAETEDLESETDRLINSYGAGNTPEKTIIFLSNLSSTSGLSVTSIEFGKSENVTVDENGKRLKGAAEAPDPTKSSGSSDSEKDQDDSDKSSKKNKKSNPYFLYKYQVTFSYTGSYAQMKRAIEFIEDYGERTTVNDITSTYDETTNNLTGSMTLNMYTLSGTAQEYKAPSVSGSLGNADIFG